MEEKITIDHLIVALNKVQEAYLDLMNAEEEDKHKLFYRYFNLVDLYFDTAVNVLPRFTEEQMNYKKRIIP